MKRDNDHAEPGDAGKTHETLARLRSQLEDEFALMAALAPYRDPDNLKRAAKLQDAYVEEIQRLQHADLLPEETMRKALSGWLQKPIIVCGAWKSGTTMTTEILDNHPQLVALPVDSELFGQIEGRQGKEYSSQIQGWGLYWVNRLINPRCQPPFWTLGEDPSTYRAFLTYAETFLKTLPEQPKSLALAPVAALYALFHGQKGKMRGWVEKTPCRNEFRTEAILKMFPEAKFIHVVRDPRVNLASVRRNTRLKNRAWEVVSASRVLAASLEAALSNRARHGEAVYHIVRYEDLCAKTECVLSDLCRFLSIEMADSLFVPSVNGKPAAANSMYRHDIVSGVIRRAAERDWRGEILSHEAAWASKILRPLALRFGYAWPKSRLLRARDTLSYWLYALSTRVAAITKPRFAWKHEGGANSTDAPSRKQKSQT